MAAGDRLEGCLEIGEGLDAIDLRGFDQRGNAALGPAAFVVAREECVLANEGNRSDQILDAVGDVMVKTFGTEKFDLKDHFSKLFPETARATKEFVYDVGAAGEELRQEANLKRANLIPKNPSFAAQVAITATDSLARSLPGALTRNPKILLGTFVIA